MYILFFCITATHFFIYSKIFVDFLEFITINLIVPFINKLYKINNIEKYLEINLYSLDLISDLDDFEDFIVAENEVDSTSSELPELIDITKEQTEKEEQIQMEKEDKHELKEKDIHDLEDKHELEEKDTHELKDIHELEEKEDINKLFVVDKNVLDLVTNNYVKTESEIDTETILIENIE